MSIKQLLKELDVWTLLELSNSKRCGFCKKRKNRFLISGYWSVCLKCYNAFNDISDLVDEDGITENLVDWYLSDKDSILYLNHLYESQTKEYTKNLNGDVKIQCNLIHPLINRSINDPRIRLDCFKVIDLDIRFNDKAPISLR